MKLAITVLLASLLLVIGGIARAQQPQPPIPAPVDQYYRLGAGDEVEIKVYGEEDLTVRSRIGDTGTISYPFMGEITAKGLTLGELQQIVVKGLKGSYLLNPAVSVNIVDYRPFFLNGEVNKPGAIPYQPGITLRKAIAMAGGFTERANRSGGDVLRGEAKVKSIGLDDQLKPGDIVTIKQSFF